MKERRKEPRVNVSFPVSCNSSRQPINVYTVCKDLSNRGVKIITDSDIPCGESVRLNINLISEVVHLSARVMWSNRESYASRYCLGLKFTDANARAKTYLSRFLTSMEANQ